MSKWVSYKNGNYTVYLDLVTGTKVRKNDLDFFDCDTVESMDIKITNSCDMGCPMCFTEDTLIQTAETTKKISDIEVGEYVKSFDTTTNTFTDSVVARTFKRKYKGKICCIKFSNGVSIRCTPNHKFLTNRGWVCAQELTPDDEITTL